MHISTEYTSKSGLSLQSKSLLAHFHSQPASKVAKDTKNKTTSCHPGSHFSSDIWCFVHHTPHLVHCGSHGVLGHALYLGPDSLDLNASQFQPTPSTPLATIAFLFPTVAREWLE